MDDTKKEISSWQPKWKVNVGSNCEVGITIDDHCFVVLIHAYEMTGGEIEFTGEWKPASWIPKAAAEFMVTKVAEL